MSDLAYPQGSAARARWILGRRTPKAKLDPAKPYAFLLEQERDVLGHIVPVATLFLTNRECPWRCLMCDLWKNTLPEAVSAGAIPAQMDYGLRALDASAPSEETGSAHRPRQIKLYNSGSFFDEQAIPPEDYRAIAARAARFDRVIVECHPALVGKRVWEFQQLLAARGPCRLEVAMGLETTHPKVLPLLNKGMTLDQFARAAQSLTQHGVDLRAFVLVRPPFLEEDEALDWALRSAAFAFDCRATAVSLIPTRGGNGALEALAAQGHFAPPKLRTLEDALRGGLAMKRGRVFADLWDLSRFSRCTHCFDRRAAALDDMNKSQQIHEPVGCPVCRDP